MTIRHTMLALVTPLALVAGAAAQCQLETTLFDPDGRTGSTFGHGLVLQGDRLIVGDHPGFEVSPFIGSGRAHVYERAEPGLPWTRVAELASPQPSGDDLFGSTVALAGDLAAVAAPRATGASQTSGRVHVFERDPGGTWLETGQLVQAGLIVQARFGRSLAIDGDRILVGAQNGAYLFARDQGGPGAWGQEAELVPQVGTLMGKDFGRSVALAGEVAVVGDPGDDGISVDAGAIHVFERDVSGPGQWGTSVTLRVDDSKIDARAGTSLALAGSQLVVGAPGESKTGNDSGMAYVWRRVSTFSWTLEDELDSADAAPADRFAQSVAADGSRIVVGAPGAEVGFELGDLLALALDESSAVLYGSNGFRLVTVDPLSGVVLPVSDEHHFATVEALAIDPLLGRLYGYELGPRQLVWIDPATGVATPIGAPNPGSGHRFRSLAFDPGARILYAMHEAAGVGLNSDRLYRLDLVDGSPTLIGGVGQAGSEMRGLAFDCGTGLLHAVDHGTGELYVIDPTTGLATVVAATGATSPSSLTCSGTGGELLAVDVFSDELVTIDTSMAGLLGQVPVALQDPPLAETGAAYVFEPAGGGGWSEALRLGASAPEAQDHFGQAVGLQGGTLVVGVPGDDEVAPDTGSAVVYEDTTPVAYCTAGTTSGGCTAMISAVGTATPSSATGFDVTVASVDGQRQGLIYFGTLGAKATPWGAGTSFLCVRGPHQRTPVQGSGGTAGACDGALSLDFNAWMAANPAKAPAAGATVWMQGWFRDPPAPKNTSLSDALRFGICP